MRAYTLDAACASSLYAIKLAADELLAGRADAMLAGGVSRPDCLYTQMGFSQLRALSPSGRCSPFDARADGLVVGEGAGVFLLKRLEDAVRDGDRILAVIAGVGLSNDVGGGLLAPNSEGQLRAMRDAYRAAGWAPNDVDLIECHATGTPVGDAVEFASLKALWGRDGWRPGQCVIGSVKSTVGHLLTAAGASGLTKVLCAMRERRTAADGQLRRPRRRALGWRGRRSRSSKSREAWRRRSAATPRRAAISGFGFGGVNAHLLLEEYQNRNTSPERQRGDEPNPLACASGLVRTPKRPSPSWGWTPASARGTPCTHSRSACWAATGRAASRRDTIGASSTASGRGAKAWTRRRSPGSTSTNLHVAADRFRIPPREFQEALPQQVLMLLAADAALAGVKLPDEDPAAHRRLYRTQSRPQYDEFHFRWWVLKHAEEWAERLGLRPSSPEYAAWKRDAARRGRSGPQRQPRHGGAGQHRRQPHRQGVPPRRPKFHPFERGNVGYCTPGPRRCRRCGAANLTRPW